MAKLLIFYCLTCSFLWKIETTTLKSFGNEVHELMVDDEKLL